MNVFKVNHIKAAGWKFPTQFAALRPTESRRLSLWLFVKMITHSSSYKTPSALRDVTQKPRSRPITLYKYLDQYHILLCWAALKVVWWRRGCGRELDWRGNAQRKTKKAFFVPFAHSLSNPDRNNKQTKQQTNNDTKKYRKQWDKEDVNHSEDLAELLWSQRHQQILPWGTSVVFP